MATLHDYPLLGIAGIILLFAFLGWAALTDIPSALKTGKVKEFDRHRNTYNRKEEPFAFWSSIFIYVMIGGCCSALSMWAVFVFLERLFLAEELCSIFSSITTLPPLLAVTKDVS